MMKTTKPESIDKKEMWAYFSPDGAIQVRSLDFSKKVCRRYIPYNDFPGTTWKDYERNGYTMHKVLVDIQILK